MTRRREFPTRVRVAALERCGGVCEHPDCTTRLRPGDLFYDHIVPDAIGGEPTIDNCQCLCRAHHDPKTFKDDIPRIAKTRRQSQKHMGARKTSQPILGSRASGWKHRMDGIWEKRT